MYKARKIKITVESGDITIRWLPAISMKFIRGLSKFAYSMMLQKYRNSKDENDWKKYEYMSHITRNDLNIIFDEFMNHEPFEIVNVQDENGKTNVRIYTL